MSPSKSRGRRGRDVTANMDLSGGETRAESGIGDGGEVEQKESSRVPIPQKPKESRFRTATSGLHICLLSWAQELIKDH